MKNPTVSVIMPTYNHAGFVAKSIDSVLSQRDVNFEFLISDDGSSDATREIISTITDKRITFYPNTVNRGACVVTNELIQHSKGEFIALINSDDIWAEADKLAYQVDIMRQNPNLSACFGRARFIDREGKAIDKSNIPQGSVFDQENRSKGAWLRRFFELGNCICHPTMLIRKACYNELGYYSNRMRQLPDLDMWIRLVKRYDIFISERELINFRIMPGENASSQTASNSIRTINEHLLIAESFFDDVSREDLIDGFQDILVIKDIPSKEHLDIEKCLMYFNYNQWLGKPYALLGLLKMSKLLNSIAHSQILDQQYGINDRWFQNKMGDIDVLRPKIVATISEEKAKLHRRWTKIFSTPSRN